mmetsp:Transcript_14939/g.31000  ORF Transcript_14939/g.31000 Transcript_14939/m.31000 type:complete len:228 (-) Transcript_14939:170-853(-)
MYLYLLQTSFFPRNLLYKEGPSLRFRSVVLLPNYKTLSTICLASFSISGSRAARASASSFSRAVAADWYWASSLALRASREASPSFSAPFFASAIMFAASCLASATTLAASSSYFFTSPVLSCTLESFSLRFSSRSSRTFPTGENHVLSRNTISTRNCTAMIGSVTSKSKSFPGSLAASSASAGAASSSCTPTAFSSAENLARSACTLFRGLPMAWALTAHLALACL